MSLKLLKQKYSALLLFFLDYKALLYCFTILTISISSSKLLEDVIFYQTPISNRRIFLFLLPTILLQIFFTVSYRLFMCVNKFTTFAQILLLSLLLTIPLTYFKFVNISQNFQKVQDFTGKKVWIVGGVVSRERTNTFLFDSGKKGLGNSLIRFSQYPVLHVGQRCKMYANVVQPSNFDDFDYRKYLFRKGIYSILEVQEYECSKGNTALEFRYKLERVVEKSLPEPHASLLIGIMFGSKRIFAEDFKQALNLSGVSHVVSASGYNVALVVAGIENLSKRFSGKGVVALKLLGIWSFCIFSGLSASLMRSTVMFSLYFIALFLGRESNKGVCLLLCITVLMLFNPFLIHDVGFLFSFVCTTGLVFFTRCFQKSRSRYFKNSVLPTLTCLLFSLPISLIFFNKVSIVSILSNIVAVPIVNSTIFWGLASTVVNMVFNAKWLYAIPFVQLSIFKYFVEVFSKVKMVELELSTYIPFVVMYMGLFLFCLLKYPVSSNNHYLKQAKQYAK